METRSHAAHLNDSGTRLAHTIGGAIATLHFDSALGGSSDAPVTSRWRCQRRFFFSFSV